MSDMLFFVIIFVAFYILTQLVVSFIRRTSRRRHDDKAVAGFYQIGNYRTTIDIAWCRDFNTDWYRQKGFAERLAWRLRNRADNLDGGISYRLSGIIPSSTNPEEFAEALRFGMNAVCKYLDEVEIDKRVN